MVDYAARTPSPIFARRADALISLVRPCKGWPGFWAACRWHLPMPAAYLRHRRTVAIDAYLNDLSRHMTAAPKDADYQRAVYATFHAAIAEADSETPGAAAVLSLAAFFAPSDIPEELLQSARRSRRSLVGRLFTTVANLLGAPPRAGGRTRSVGGCCRSLGIACGQRAIRRASRTDAGDAPAMRATRRPCSDHCRACAGESGNARTRLASWLGGRISRERAVLADVMPLFKASHAIFERRAQADPGNAGWQADLAASYGKLGQLHRLSGDRAAARRLFEAGRAIVAPFAAEAGHQLWIGYLRSFDVGLAELDG